MAEFKYEVTQKHGKLSESSKGWTTELRSISWNEKEAKYDLREWAPNGEKMGKGITLSTEELVKLKEFLNNMEI
ncbi:PC4/YdbC family ssDNA-binding protein [Tissierella sp. MB52-C2]|uniref:YdbC family protein n=1 Tax=Tissierella sp. MB52-C2 TaxID=3070999 RepID=UPI00280BD23E|nr:PC4/YdbC family ssDNA-binding protein [Tissierella sp. MB52-C2]WMM26033.1 PC4/YdbC family ssDNA-binding protein [Tissierella sp. MB52-C2]